MCFGQGQSLPWLIDLLVFRINTIRSKCCSVPQLALHYLHERAIIWATTIYTLKRIYIYIYIYIYICRVSDDDTRTDILCHWLCGKMAGIPQQTTFSNAYCQMKIKCFEKWSKLQHGIGYWLGAVQATSHCLNQCWHSSSTHIYVSRCDWIEYYATMIMMIVQ